MPPNAVKWVREMVEYNVPGGKLNRGLAVVEGFRQLRRGVLKESELFRACALGWCIEWLQAFFLVADDIMDASITRRGQPCWYKVPKVEMKACNDCILLEAHIYKIIKTVRASERASACWGAGAGVSAPSLHVGHSDARAAPRRAAHLNVGTATRSTLARTPSTQSCWSCSTRSRGRPRAANFWT